MSEQDSETDTAHAFNDKKRSKFLYLTVRFESMRVSALVDTGSSVNIISEQLYNSLPYSKKFNFKSDVSDSIVLANNEKVAIVGTAVVKMNISGVNHNVFTYILKLSSHPIILGTNYLMENKMVLDFSQMTAFPKKAKVYCTKRTVIMPNAETIIWGKVPSNVFYGKQGICTTSKYILSKGLIASKAVVSVPQNRQIPVKILNPNNCCIDLYKGKAIAEFDEITSDHELFPLNRDTNKQYVQNIDLIQENVQLRDNITSDNEMSNFNNNFPFEKCEIPDSQNKDLQNFLFKNRDIFVTKTNSSLGFTDVVQHKIILKPDAKPKYQKPYRLSPDKKEVLRHHLDNLLEQGIISPVSPDEELPITSPIVLVTKRVHGNKSSPPYDRDASISQFRFCCDFRYLNSQCQNFSYNIPDLNDLTESFSQRTPNLITSIDLSSGFFQMKIAPSSSKYTAFNTCFGTFKFNRLPMGLSSAPNSFQLLMDKILSGLTFKSCLCYLDDVLVCSETFTEHLDDLTEVFNGFRSAGLKLNPQKCHFARTSCIFLGHHISAEGLKPPPDRVQALQTYPSPRNIKELRRVLGMFGWFRKFIPNYSQITQPLTKLLRKSTLFHWTEEQENALKSLKISLLNSEVLAFPKFNIPFFLAVDSSSKGIGYMLYQKHQDESGNFSKIRVVRFGSKALNHWQRSYGPT